MILLLRHQALLVLVALLMFFTNLGNYALFNDDESKNATCGAEMFRRGDWIVPTFNEDLRTDKPILVYWFMLTSFHLFGISEFASRFASSILAVGSTLLTYHLGRKLYSAQVGFLAGLILCTCLLFSAVGRAATPDSTFVFFVTLAFTSYVWVVARQRGGNFSGDTIANSDNVDSPDDSQVAKTADMPLLFVSGSILTHPLVPASWKLVAPFYISIGLAVLAKGPAGLILPLVSLILFFLIAYRERDLATDVLKSPEGPWWRRGSLITMQLFRSRTVIEVVRGMNLPIGIGIVAAISLPWYLTVGFATKGEWLRGFLFDHNIGRALVAKEGHNGFPLYQLYYVVAILLGCFPWSVFLPVALFRMRQRFTDGERWRDSDRLLACWAGVWLVFFSLASTRLPNYMLPIYPAVALILARYFYDWERDEVDSGVYSFNICCRALLIVGGMMIVGITVAAYLLFSGDQWLAIAGAIPMIGAFAAIKFLDQEMRRRVMQSLIATSLLLAFLIVGIAPARLHQYQDTPIFIEKARSLAQGGEFEIATYRYFQPSVVFYARKKVTILNTPREVANFFSDHAYGFVITPLSKHNELRDEVMDNVTELMRHRDFLRREELILLGRN